MRLRSRDLPDPTPAQARSILHTFTRWLDAEVPHVKREYEALQQSGYGLECVARLEQFITLWATYQILCEAYEMVMRPTGGVISVPHYEQD